MTAFVSLPQSVQNYFPIVNAAHHFVWWSDIDIAWMFSFAIFWRLSDQITLQSETFIFGENRRGSAAPHVHVGICW